MAKQAKSANKVVASSGNVFADLGLPDAAELDTKVRLAVAVNRLLESRWLTQAAAATALSISQPKISALKHYKLQGFSVERLMTFLTALGSDIEIRVHLPKRFFLTRENFGQCRLSDFRENAALIRSVPRWSVPGTSVPMCSAGIKCYL
jgi:predicted XRE-type DNA-binding protein